MVKGLSVDSNWKFDASSTELAILRGVGVGKPRHANKLF